MNYQNVPDLLRVKPNWVVWSVLGENPKAPFQPESLLKLRAIPAKSGVPNTWSSFETATECVRRGLARGIGFEFDGGSICGIDLDRVIENGIVKPEALEIVESLSSYTEVGPSGNGLHIFVTADGVNLTRHRKQDGFVEIYNSGRYFTVTWDVYRGYDRISDRTAELQALHDRYLMPDEKVQMLPAFSMNPQQNTNDYLTRGLSKDPILRACWNGDRRGGDESASDQALMNKLAYWCNADPAAMIAAFLQSPYYAGKDDAHKRKCRRSDYLPNTARKACDGLRSTAARDAVRYKKGACSNGRVLFPNENER